MTDKLAAKIKALPAEPGVYFHKSADGEIIYIGKAANLKNRVRQYFQSSRLRDAKTDALVAEIADTDWITVETEIDALFLESEMIKRYMPRYNILLRDDKSQLYVRIPLGDAYPAISFTRGPQDDGATYFGPYYNGFAVKKALRYLRRIFPYSTHDLMPKRLCLQYHIGLCPGVEQQKITSREYKETLKKLMRYLRGERKSLMRELEVDMKRAAASHRYEDAAALRNRLRDLGELQKQIVFGDREFMDASKDQGLSGLQQLLGLPEPPRRIEGYDISHMSGTNNVASMVVATNGLADKSEYRKFRMQLPGNDDFGHMRETMARRFSGRHDSWPKPDLLLIDGGKGQLSAAAGVLHDKGLAIPVIGLAKREEQIIIHQTLSGVHLAINNINPEEKQGRSAGFVSSSDEFLIVDLPNNSHIMKLLQRIRNESHRFAVSYHSTLKRQGATRSLLDDIPGIGPVTRKKIITSFGSGRGAQSASRDQLTAVLGPALGKRLYAWFHPESV